eukprot:scaffold271459_cov33-Tisochrysis_lutea.AAC.4
MNMCSFVGACADTRAATVRLVSSMQLMLSRHGYSPQAAIFGMQWDSAFERRKSAARNMTTRLPHTPTTDYLHFIRCARTCNLGAAPAGRHHQ